MYVSNMYFLILWKKKNFIDTSEQSNRDILDYTVENYWPKM